MNAKLFDHMVRYGIGLDPWFWVKNADTPNFPPHNIEQLGEDRYRLTLAVAGFSPDEIQVTVEADLLTLKGFKGNPHFEDDPVMEDTVSYDPPNKVLYNGIAFRDWNRQFKIGEHVRVESARMEHGLLMIDLVRELPEAQKPKLIQIMS